jgi:hypothetical protein
MAAGAWRAEIFIRMTRLLVLEQLRQLRAAKLVHGRDQSNSDKQALANDYLTCSVALAEYSTHSQTDFLTIYSIL